MQVQYGTGPGVRRSKSPLLAKITNRFPYCPHHQIEIQKTNSGIHLKSDCINHMDYTHSDSSQFYSIVKIEMWWQNNADRITYKNGWINPFHDSLNSRNIFMLFKQYKTIEVGRKGWLHVFLRTLHSPSVTLIKWSVECHQMKWHSPRTKFTNARIKYFNSCLLFLNWLSRLF